MFSHICAGSDIKQMFFNFLILGKSRFPPKKFYNINYWAPAQGLFFHMNVYNTFSLQDVDVVITFPPESSESTIFWFKERIEKIPGIILKTKSMTLSKGTKTRPNCYGFLISASYQG